MISLSICPQDTVHDWLITHAAFLQFGHVVHFAIRATIDVIKEGFALERSLAHVAREAFDVKHLPHG
jgi:hypothetical protein